MSPTDAERIPSALEEADEIGPRRTSRRRDRWAVWALAALFPMALFPFGAVHEPVRWVLWLVAASLSAVVLARLTPDMSLPRRLLVWSWLPGLAWVLGLLGGVPVGAAGRAWLQGRVGTVVDAALAVADAGEFHMIAVSPRAWALSAALAGAHLLVWAATAAVVCNARRAMRVAVVVVGALVAFSLLQALQVVAGAPSIYGFSGVGEGQPFFGSLVYRNVAAALLAAGLPLATALALRGTLLQRQVGGAAAVALGVAALATGSRGGLLLAPVALSVFGVLIGDRRWQSGWIGLWLVGLGVVAVGGVDLGAISAWLRPDVHPSDLSNGRWSLWADPVALVASSPWLGIGMGGFADAYPVVKVAPTYAVADHAHQEALETAVTQGLAALGAWALAIAWGAASLGRMALQRRNHEEGLFAAAYVAAVVTVLAGGLFDFPLRFGAGSVFLALVGGAAMGLSAREVAPTSHAWHLLGRVQWAAVAVVTGGIGFVGLIGVGPFQRDVDYATADVAALQAQLARRPLDVRASLALADRRMASAEVDGARQALDLALQQHPTHVGAWWRLARLERGAGREVEARAAWSVLLGMDLPQSRPLESFVEEALRGVPTSEYIAMLPYRGDRMCYAGLMADRAGDQATAEALYRAATEDEPGCGPLLAHRMLRWGRPPQAVLAELAPYRGCEATRVEAEIRAGFGEVDAALALRERALSECGSARSDVRRELALARIAAGDASGKAVLSSLLRDNPDDVVTRRALLYHAEQEHRTDEVKEHLGWLVSHARANEAEIARFNEL